MPKFSGAQEKGSNSLLEVLSVSATMEEREGRRKREREEVIDLTDEEDEKFAKRLQQEFDEGTYVCMYVCMFVCLYVYDVNTDTLNVLHMYVCVFRDTKNSGTGTGR